MTPFVCHVEGASRTASPVDVEYAIPPRRCLDSTLCSFGPRQPAYWLGAKDPKINMPEDNMQSPNYSIIYGFREGAQHDIFVNTNPRRHVTKPIPVQLECNGKISHITEPSAWKDLQSPNCRCKAELQADGNARIVEGDTPISTVNIGGNSGPQALVNNTIFKAGTQYFPLSKGPLRLSLNNKCYLYVIDSKGVVVWESAYERPFAREKYVHKAFTGMSPDPSEWPDDGRIYIKGPTIKPSSTPTRRRRTSTQTRSPSSKPPTITTSGLLSTQPTSTNHKRNPVSKEPTFKPAPMMPAGKPLA